MKYTLGNPRFSLGHVVMTQGAAALPPTTGIQLASLIQRHVNGDWGTMCAEDKALNDEALRTGEARLHSSYEVDGTTIWIITEWDRSVTTILLPEEY